MSAPQFTPMEKKPHWLYGREEEWRISLRNWNKGRSRKQNFETDYTKISVYFYRCVSVDYYSLCYGCYVKAEIWKTK